MDMPVNVPVDDPNADTEWNDILRKHGVIPEKPPSPTPFIEEALGEARRLAHENRLEGKDLDELDELEDEEDEDFLNQYRQKRMGEMAALQNASVYNQVYPIQKPEYSAEVTEASNKAFVLVLLTSSNGVNTESRVMIEVWRELAKKYGDIKFCQMQADLCIEGYPDRNTPTILVYKDGDIKRQIVTMRELQGVKTAASDIEKLLVALGAVGVNDHRVRHSGDDNDGLETSNEQIKRIQSSSINRRGPQEDDDSDWD